MSNPAPLLNPMGTILSQYANSPILTTIVSQWFASIDQTSNLNAFYNDIWNIDDTAYGYGLDVWGRIVGIGRVIQIANGSFFGWSSTAVGFGQSAPFYAGAASTSNYALNDQQFLRLIMAKALANISDATIPVLNKILLTLFPGRGNCWVSDGGILPSYFGWSSTAVGFNQGSPFASGNPTSAMTMVYNFDFALTAIDYGIMNSGVLPKPTGVAASINVI